LTATASPFAGMAVACPIGKLRPSTAARAKPLILRKAIEALLFATLHPRGKVPRPRLREIEGVRWLLF
jgi:hypothetical protein